MPKTTDVPPSLRVFNSLFEKISYRHSYSDVYCDFIDYVTACFSWEGDKELALRLQKKYDKEYPIFGQLFNEWLFVHKKQLEMNQWYDVLGEFYEIVSSSSKASRLGQFFTPPSLVTMMTQITGGKAAAKERIQDCCSGSGRMLISYHAYFPGNYTFGADIDSICTKMTAINMALHGCEGEAVCMNSLNPEDWRFGYRVNPHIHTIGIPHLVPIKKEQSVQFQYWENRRTANESEVKEEPKVGKHGQLSFF